MVIPGSNTWRYVSIIFQAIFSRYIIPWNLGLIEGSYLQSIGSWNSHWNHHHGKSSGKKATNRGDVVIFFHPNCLVLPPGSTPLASTGLYRCSFGEHRHDPFTNIHTTSLTTNTNIHPADSGLLQTPQVRLRAKWAKLRGKMTHLPSRGYHFPIMSGSNPDISSLPSTWV